MNLRSLQWAVLCALAVAFPNSNVLDAQTSQLQDPKFDVATIRQHQLNDPTSTQRWSRSGYVLRNGTLMELILFAYDTNLWLVQGLPSWAKNTSWDVEAKIIEPGKGVDALPVETRRRMIRDLLESRFMISAHFEARQKSIYEMRVEPGHLKLKLSNPEPGSSSDWKWALGNGAILANKMPMPRLAEALSTVIERTVSDKTGLAGNYSFELHWSQAANSVDEDGRLEYPSLPTALSEQLGLKLVPATAPVSTLVVTNILRPTPN